MTDNYVPLTDEQVAEIADTYALWVWSGAPALYRWTPKAIEALLADREHYKRRAEAAERRIASRCDWCAGDKDIDHPCKNGCDQ